MTTAMKDPKDMTTVEILAEFGWQPHAPFGTPESTPRREAMRAELKRRTRVIEAHQYDPTHYELPSTW